MSRIFISYRLSDAAAEAGRIYDALEPHFGRESIFMDCLSFFSHAARSNYLIFTSLQYCLSVLG